MLAPNLSDNVSERPYTLHSLDVLGSPLQGKFERITRLARNLFEVPIAFISLNDDQHLLFKSLLGTNVVEISHVASFCEHVFLTEEVFTVPETFMDERFSKDSYVTGAPNIRFYAGYPIQLNHQKLGTVSLVDHKPRYFSSDQLILLKDVAALIETEIQNYAISSDKGKLALDLDQARLASMVDPLTNLWNRQGIYNILKHRMDEYLLNGTSFAVAILDIDNFKAINDTYGHESGDQTLKTIANILIEGCRETDAIGRWGGEEFLILINESNVNYVNEIAERIRSTLESQKVSVLFAPPLDITVTIGLTGILPWTYPTLEEMINKADQALYQGKRGGRNQVVRV
jgi:diguanylate cyclase (GGDEF)-like protein